MSKSFLWECTEAARVCMDPAVSKMMVDRTSDLRQAIERFNEHVTTETMQQLNFAWVRAHVVFERCKLAEPPNPNGGAMPVPQEMRKAA